ncbi:chorismate synthase [Coriobacteriia bacterium Es71-Z0120]|uniref:chorismate synthase n=1 Tax=Parvivirga hydrogeniphila TaxID=2939460 RepID=UPI002260B915|nr:chorismate synthase [Parvivirga hydrogeniphila]MCL4079145.1 chorismate synthase [Parvivirga hydrogeniphila]
MRYTTAGESHGRALVAIVSDVPAGVPVDAAAIDRDLARRQRGYGRGGRMAIERDQVQVLSGVRFGATIGSPVALVIANRDWDQWLDVMAVSGEPVDRARVTAPRPGHADLPGVLRNATHDVRDILERASARETAARVAAGAVAKALLSQLGVRVLSFVTRIGEVALPNEPDPRTIDSDSIDASDVRCPDERVSQAMRAAIDAARADGESLGGVFVVAALGVVPGLGGYAEAGQRLDARIGAAMLSIPAIKGVEIGDGFAAAARPGSQVHDPILYRKGEGIVRPTNHAGGIEGGMTNGEPVVVRAAMKPIPTLMRPLPSVDLATLEPVDAAKERSDVCAVPAAAVVAEAELALVLATAYQEAFGGRCLSDMLDALERYKARLVR